jgi:streptothricin acetyltransferase
MTLADVSRLTEIDPNFESPAYLDVQKAVDGLNVTWRMIECPLEKPIVRSNFDFDEEERDGIRHRLESGDGFWLVAEHTTHRNNRLVGMVDVERQDWREAGFVWNIAVDRDCRGQGIGSRLMSRVVEWARTEKLRAIILETQTNNWLACRFYQHFGFVPSGVDDHFYTNQDVANKEVALFWTYEL